MQILENLIIYHLNQNTFCKESEIYTLVTSFVFKISSQSVFSNKEERISTIKNYTGSSYDLFEILTLIEKYGNPDTNDVLVDDIIEMIDKLKQENKIIEVTYFKDNRKKALYFIQGTTIEVHNAC